MLKEVHKGIYENHSRGGACLMAKNTEARLQLAYNEERCLELHEEI